MLILTKIRQNIFGIYQKIYKVFLKLLPIIKISGVGQKNIMLFQKNNIICDNNFI